jgi:hypothetical protein
VVIAAVDSVGTSDSGAYALQRLPAGTQWVRVRAIGYAPFAQPVRLRAGDTLRLDVELQAIVMVDSIRVTAHRGWAAGQMDEFAYRKRVHIWGHQLDEDDLRGHTSLRTVFGSIPGADVRYASGGWGVFFFRPHLSGTLGCAATVMIDGRPGVMEELQSMDMRRVIGVEVYSRSLEVPVQYQSVAGCGLILVWTTRMRQS